MRVGTLDTAGALKPDVHIYTRYKAKWLKLPKRTASFKDYYNTGKLWPKNLHVLGINFPPDTADLQRGSGRQRGGIVSPGPKKVKT